MSHDSPLQAHTSRHTSTTMHFSAPRARTPPPSPVRRPAQMVTHYECATLTHIRASLITSEVERSCAVCLRIAILSTVSCIFVSDLLARCWFMVCKGKTLLP